jgi:hypothetical protein
MHGGVKMAKFFCDQMLGTLTKWLRFLGFDVSFASGDVSDEEIIKLSKREGRILLTRDKLLSKLALKEKVENIFLESTDLKSVIVQVIKSSGVKLNPDNYLSRCSICNSPVRKASEEEAKEANLKGKIPDRVLKNSNDFWYCEFCKKYYWLGSHWRNMLNDIKEIERMIQTGVSDT